MSLKNWMRWAALAFAFASPAAFAQIKLVPEKSEISFTSKQMGAAVDGRFKRFDVQADFNPRQPAGGKLGLTVELASVSIGAPETEAELAKAEWFDTAKFPKATFQSTAIKAAGPGRFDVTGKLTIRGAARDVVVPVTLTQAGGVSTASGSFSIKRLAFGLGASEWKDTSLVADDVQVRFKLTLTGMGPL